MDETFFTKSNIAKWLLYSLIPLGFVTYGSLFLVVLFAFGDSATTNDAMAFFAIVFNVGITLWIAALVIGLVLRSMARRAMRQAQREAQQYGEMHGWQNISPIQWKIEKPNGVFMTALRSLDTSGYILRVDIHGDVLAASGFQAPMHALHFGDYFWSSVLSNATGANPETLSQSRYQWNQTHLPTLQE